jgi:hypothetical protein
MMIYDFLVFIINAREMLFCDGKTNGICNALAEWACCGLNARCVMNFRMARR